MPKPSEVLEAKPTVKRLQAMARGRKGGYATALSHSPEWLQERARKGGQVLVTMYSVDYYRHIANRRKVRKGWPQGKLRKSVSRAEQAIQQEVQAGAISATSANALQHILDAVERELR
jgi:general stress protein YciG